MLTDNVQANVTSNRTPSRLERMLRIEWLGQTIASLCWIGSVLAYGISSNGDWLQLLAASAWLTANISAIAANEVESKP
ncbi:hypothetical protein [Planctomycetes bacterium K23_9]|uniref:Uncharacterized protein n=1 Tax=Stieleria marina TaxID=1930275 RepID=A0A517P294_9BACT|nr:hypothetical protein K239x_55160 [Planctomycetes bacterium K23_9]